MAKKNRADKALDAADPAAGLVSFCVGVAGALGLMEKYSITADQIAMWVGLSFPVIAGARAWLDRRRKSRDLQAIKLLLIQRGITDADDIRAAIEALTSADEDELG